MSAARASDVKRCSGAAGVPRRRSHLTRALRVSYAEGGHATRTNQKRSPEARARPETAAGLRACPMRDGRAGPLRRWPPRRARAPRNAPTEGRARGIETPVGESRKWTGPTVFPVGSLSSPSPSFPETARVEDGAGREGKVEEESRPRAVPRPASRFAPAVSPPPPLRTVRQLWVLHGTGGGTRGVRGSSRSR